MPSPCVTGLQEIRSSLHSKLQAATDRSLTGWEHDAVLCEGEKNLLDKDIPTVAGMQPDGNFASKDLYTAISSGDYPEWYMYIQASAPILYAHMPQRIASSLSPSEQRYQHRW